MMYDRQTLLSVWAELGHIGVLPSDKLMHLTSLDYMIGRFYCPKCQKFSNNLRLFKVDNQWACSECHQFKTMRSKHYRPIYIYRITNDLIEFFGQHISTDVLFNPVAMDGFVEFAKLKETPPAYILFMDLIRTLFQKEVGTIKILNFLNRAQKEIDVMKKNAKKPTGKKKIEEKIIVQPSDTASVIAPVAPTGSVIAPAVVEQQLTSV